MHDMLGTIFSIAVYHTINIKTRNGGRGKTRNGGLMARGGLFFARNRSIFLYRFMKRTKKEKTLLQTSIKQFDIFI